MSEHEVRAIGTCKIFELCDNPKCINGCLAQKAVAEEREALILIVQKEQLRMSDPKMPGVRFFSCDLIEKLRRGG